MRTDQNCSACDTVIVDDQDEAEGNSSTLDPHWHSLFASDSVLIVRVTMLTMRLAKMLLLSHKLLHWTGLAGVGVARCTFDDGDCVHTYYVAASGPVYVERGEGE